MNTTKVPNLRISVNTGLRNMLYCQLIYARPYKRWDEAMYWDCAEDMLNNQDHPAYRFIPKEIQEFVEKIMF